MANFERRNKKMQFVSQEWKWAKTRISTSFVADLAHGSSRKIDYVDPMSKAVESVELSNSNGLLQSLFYQNQQIRMVTKAGELWFVAKDVCDILGVANSRDALKSVPDDEKMTVAEADGQKKRGGAQFYTIINEPGFYRLIFKSNKPEAEDFKHWVFHKVLPSIRKTGMYDLYQDYSNAELEEALITRGLRVLTQADVSESRYIIKLSNYKSYNLVQDKRLQAPYYAVAYLPPTYYNNPAKADLWLPRSDIAQLLGFKNPIADLTRLHLHHFDELADCSAIVKVDSHPDMFNYVVVYNMQGIMYLCDRSDHVNARVLREFFTTAQIDMRVKLADKLHQAQIDKLKATYDESINLVGGMREDHEKLVDETNRQKDQIELLKAKVDELEQTKLISLNLDNVPEFAGKDLFNMQQLTNILNCYTFTDVERNDLFVWLRKFGFLDSSDHWNMPTEVAKRLGLFVCKTWNTDIYGVPTSEKHYQPLATRKGVAFFCALALLGEMFNS